MQYAALATVAFEELHKEEQEEWKNTTKAVSYVQYHTCVLEL